VQISLIVNKTMLFVHNVATSFFHSNANCAENHNNFKDSGYIEAAKGRFDCASESLKNVTDPLSLAVTSIATMIGFDYNAIPSTNPSGQSDAALAGDVDAFEYAANQQGGY
jgi:hypothetical protein